MSYQLSGGSKGLKKGKIRCFHNTGTQRPCRRCITVYLGPGAGGEDCYIYDKKGNYLADVRNHVWYCHSHQPKNKMVKKIGELVVKGNNEKANVSRKGQIVLEVFDNATTTQPNPGSAFERAEKWARQQNE